LVTNSNASPRLPANVRTKASIGVGGSAPQRDHANASSKGSPMLKSVVTTLAALMLTAGGAQAQVKRVGAPTSGISSVVVVPAGYDIVYVAGMTAGGAGAPIAEGMDTKAQTLLVLEKLKAALAAEGLSFADVTMMNVYLVGDPAKEGKMDSPGMNEAYRQYFGTDAQPNKPARVTVQVAALGSPRTYVEISLQAARKK
jgi:enamine deaminase RidA (YjgF/YER057c/UK114 family)